LLPFTALANPPALGETAPDVKLMDTNPRSATHNMKIGSSILRGQFTLWYFRSNDCDNCSTDLDTIHKVWQELSDDGIDAAIVTVVSDQEQALTPPPSTKSVMWLHDHGSVARDAWGASDSELVLVGPKGKIRTRTVLDDVMFSAATSTEELEYQIEMAAFGPSNAVAGITTPSTGQNTQ
jgi:peroxiredoxin